MKNLFMDMDGTLCASRQPASSEMVFELERLVNKYDVFIVSGAELSRINDQIPVKGINFFAQNGNHVVVNGKTLWTNELLNKDKVLEHINLIAKNFGYVLGDDMVEDRGSEIVVSFVGFHAPFDLKNRFDPDRKIRLEMLKRFPYPNAYVAGSTGIDFIPFTKGENIAVYLSKNNLRQSDCLYIGDALEKGANDESVCGVVPTFSVKNSLDTLDFIRQL